MALMLRETAVEETANSEALVPYSGAQQQANNSILPSKKNMAGALAGQGAASAAAQDQAQQIDELNMNPQELGQLIVNLQDEIKIIKLQLENLPGYDIGEVPPHLTKLKVELEKTFESLERKNELLVNSMSMNFGATQQDLPNFRLPEIVSARGAVGKKSLMGMQTDILGMDQLYGAAIDKRKLMVPKGANILQKPLTKATKSYAAKRGAKNRPLPPFRNTAAVSDMQYLNDPPPISEDAINEGMMSLVTKGLVPKDVDLTPAFEKGAPPVTCKGVKFYDKREQFVRREVATGGEGASNVRFDLQPVQTRILMPIRGTGSAHKSNVLKPIEEE